MCVHLSFGFGFFHFAREVDFDLCVMLYFCHCVITHNVGQDSDVHRPLIHSIEFFCLYTRNSTRFIHLHQKMWLTH